MISNKQLSSQQRKTMADFDRFNELEAQCRIRTRLTYVRTLHELASAVKIPFEKMTREDVQEYIMLQKQHLSPSTVVLRQRHLKRFFRFLAWIKQNKSEPDDKKVDIRDVKAPYQVSWIRDSFRPREIPFEDLPTEEEVKKIVSCVDIQRDRALLMTLWETGASPKEVLSLRIRSVMFNINLKALKDLKAL